MAYSTSGSRLAPPQGNSCWFSAHRSSHVRAKSFGFLSETWLGKACVAFVPAAPTRRAAGTMEASTNSASVTLALRALPDAYLFLMPGMLDSTGPDVLIQPEEILRIVSLLDL